MVDTEVWYVVDSTLLATNITAVVEVSSEGRVRNRMITPSRTDLLF